MSGTEKNKLTSKHRLIIAVNNTNIASWLQSNDALKKWLLTTIYIKKQGEIWGIEWQKKVQKSANT